MNNQIFLSSTMLPPLEFEHTWKSPSNLSHDCFLSSTPSPDQFDSTLTSMVSSPVTPISCMTTNVANTSCYNSPRKMVKGNFPNLVNSTAFCSDFPTIYGDPGLPERAARLSCLGSKTFDGRTAQSGYTSKNFDDHSQSQRVSTTPLVGLPNSHGEHTTRNGDHGDIIGTNRKRKEVTKGKVKENDVPLHTTCNKEGNEDERNAKRSKSDENGGRDEMKIEENRGDESKKQSQNTVDPPKDYIHVRARRGQATDSHSLAERVRREKISERMKLLQDLVPGCNKVTGKALMLDEIINYVQSLQRQVEFLSMKLATVNPRLQFNTNNDCTSKDVIQPMSSSMRHPMYPVDSLATTLYGHPNQNNLTTKEKTIIMVPSLNSNPINQTQLPLVHGFPNLVPQLPSQCEGDLQAIVQMGYGRKENGFQ